MELFEFDDEYVRRLKEGDREIAAHFHSYFNEILLIKLRRKLPSPQHIDDVRQEVFARVLARLDDIQDARKLGAFVNATCNYVVLESYRSSARNDTVDSSEFDIADQTNIEEALVTEETTARVRRVLSRMPRRDASILQAIFLDEGDKEEVCRRFGIDRGYLRVLVHRAKERFKSEFRRKSGRMQIDETFSGSSSLSL